jgi:hypothetical protein
MWRIYTGSGRVSLHFDLLKFVLLTPYRLSTAVTAGLVGFAVCCFYVAKRVYGIV